MAALYAGLTIVDLTDTEDFRAGTLMVVGATGVGFVASLLGTRDRAIPAGLSQSYNTGLALGLLNGLLLAVPADIESTEGLLGLGLVGMGVGGAAGALIADRAKPTVAQGRVVGLGATLGIATAGLGVASLRLDVDEDTLLLLLTAGLDVGAASGMVIAPQLDWSKNRGTAVSLGMFLGGLGGLGVGALIVGEPEDSSEGRIIAATSLAGLWGGLALSVYLSREMSPDNRFQKTPPLAVAPTVGPNGQRGLVVGGTF